jgi:hypothetical protein
MAHLQTVSATEDVRLLLTFLADVQPAARIGHLGAQDGEGPSHTIDCPECNGAGWKRVRLKAGLQSWRNEDGALVAECQLCEGRKTLTVDDYTNRQVGTAEVGTIARTRSVFCDGCGGSGTRGQRRCKYCDGSGSRSVSVDTGSDVRPTRKRDEDAEAQMVALRAGRATGSAKLWAAGSFAALDQALSELTPPMRFRVWRAYVAVDAEPEPDLLAILAARVRQIERGKIRVPGELRRWQASRPTAPPYIASTGERNQAIRALRDEGQTFAAIGRRFGVSRAYAHRVCTK